MDQDIALEIGRVIDGATAADIESYTLDFKEVGNSSNTEKLLVDAAICFANAEGGTIVIGVDDDGPLSLQTLRRSSRRARQRPKQFCSGSLKTFPGSSRQRASRRV